MYEMKICVYAKEKEEEKTRRFSLSHMWEKVFRITYELTSCMFVEYNLDLLHTSDEYKRASIIAILR